MARKARASPSLTGSIDLSQLAAARATLSRPLRAIPVLGDCTSCFWGPHAPFQMKPKTPLGRAIKAPFK